MAKKTLAEQIADLQKPEKEIDIENQENDPFSHVNDSESDESEDEDLKKGHYVNVGKSKLRSENDKLVNDKKYKGTVADRKALFDDEREDDEKFSGSEEESLEGEEQYDENAESDEEDEEEDGNSDEQDLTDGEVEDGSGVDLEQAEESDSGASLRANSDEESEASEPDTEGEEDRDANREKIKLMMAKERKHIVGRLSESATQEALKGYAILQQHKLFDSLIDTRLKAQKALTSSNMLPGDHDTLVSEKLETEDTSDKIQKAEELCYSLLDKIMQLRSKLYTKENIVAEPVNYQPKKRSLLHYLEATEKYDNVLNKYRAQVLTKWLAKTQNSSGSTAMNANRFKALNQSAEQQVSNNLADMERLVKRTKLNRRQIKPLGWDYYINKTREVEEPKQDDSEVPETQSRSLNVQENESIFDDEDFYRVLLNDLVDKKIQSSDPTSGLQYAMRGAAQAKVKKNVDNRASKGRKLKYHVQEPIANFETPHNTLKWDDDQIDEFFASLLGQKVNMREDDSEEEAVDNEPTVEENSIRLFG